MDLLPQIQETITRHRLLEVGARVVLGVSGGPDSVAMFHLLDRLSEAWNLHIHVAHLHHGIRDADADADADFVTKLAEQWGWPCTVKRVDIPAIAEREKLAIEEAARRARYAFLAEVAQCAQAPYIAVAHNADDQAETVLMHLLRGAGLAGLRGMLPVTRLHDYRLLPQDTPPCTNLTLIRPLLKTRRADIEAYCDAYGLETRFDRSNLDTTYFRNRLRHEVLPYLADINPRIRERLMVLAEIVRADYALLEEFSYVAWDELLLRRYKDALVFNLDGWRAQPLSVRRALIRRAAYHLRHNLRDVDFRHIENAVSTAQTGGTGSQSTLPKGLVVQVGYTTLSISDKHAHHLPMEYPWLKKPEAHVPVAIPGKTPLPDGWFLLAEVIKRWDFREILHNSDPLTAWVDAGALGPHTYLRARRRGDRIQPQGLGGGTMRLSDFFVNVKLPRAWRDHLPLLVSQQTILWVVGFRLSEQALIQPDKTSRVIRFRFLNRNGIRPRDGG